MPHVPGPWAADLAGYPTWRDSSVRPLMGAQKRGVRGCKCSDLPCVRTFQKPTKAAPDRTEQPGPHKAAPFKLRLSAVLGFACVGGSGIRPTTATAEGPRLRAHDNRRARRHDLAGHELIMEGHGANFAGRRSPSRDASAAKCHSIVTVSVLVRAMKGRGIGSGASICAAGDLPVDLCKIVLGSMELPKLRRVDEVLAQERCTSGLQDVLLHDCSPELSEEPPWQMPHVPWAAELAGYSHLERQRR